MDYFVWFIVISVVVVLIVARVCGGDDIDTDEIGQ